MHLLRRSAVLLATTGLLAASMFVGVAAVSANTIDPPGCTQNGIQVVIGRSPGVAQPGDTITFTVSVTNGVHGNVVSPCNVTGADVTLTTPDPATGMYNTPGATTFVLVADHDFPADGSGDISGSRTFTVPNGPLTYGFAQAQVALSGSILHDSDQVEDTADTSKTVSAAVVDANIQITPNGVNEVGTTHTFTAHVNAKAGIPGYVNAQDGTVINFTFAGPNVGTLSWPAVPPRAAPARARSTTCRWCRGSTRSTPPRRGRSSG